MLAWGNPSRGDDAVGPWLADHFRSHQNEDFTLVEDFQLQVEHLLDCREADLLLFVDACCSEKEEDFGFEEVQATACVSHTSHALAPAELLSHYRRVFNEPPPPAFLLTVPGQAFDLGQPMSPHTLKLCEQAAAFLERCLEQANAQAWTGMTRISKQADKN